MRFVPIKTDDQLDLQSLHRVRERWVMRRTAVINQIRGLLLERGITLLKGRCHVGAALPGILEDADAKLSGALRMLLAQLKLELDHLDLRIDEADALIKKTACENEACQRNMSQMTVSQMSINETTPSPQHKLHWLAEQALNWSGLPVVHVRPTVFLEGFFLTLTPDSVRESDQIRLPFGEGKTSPVAAEDVARAIAALLANPQPHISKIYHLTGPQSENMHFFAQEYSKALGRTITYQDIPVEPWRDDLLNRRWPVHVVNHLAALGDLHRAGRFDRTSHDVRTLTGQGPLSVQEFVRKNAATFTPSAKAA